MKLTKLKVSNFKSFKELDISFNDFNIVIGSNASGKSNVIDVLKFLKDIQSWGLDSAISLQGGRDYLLNLHLSRKESLYIFVQLESVVPNQMHFGISGDNIGLKFTHLEFEFEIKFKERGEGYSIINNSLRVYYDLEKINPDNGNVESNLGNYAFLVDVKRSITMEMEAPKEFNIKLHDIIPFDFFKSRLDPKKLLVEQPYVAFFMPYSNELFNSISVFDFSPKTIKSSSPVVGKVQLEENASNLPVVLKSILKDKENRKKLVSLVNDLLPFVDDLKVSETNDKSLILELKEKYYKGKFLPSTFLSDGTAHATALITALYFDNSEISIFEEPERNMHPELVRKLIQHMKSHSKNKQVFVTTHNTELLREVDPKDVLFISRTNNGYSNIIRLSEKKEIAVFLMNEIGLDELYANNLIKGN